MMIGVEQLVLFKKAKLDKAKTAQAVKDFFTEDFGHYLNLANKHLSDISSPTLDPNNVGGHDGLNHQDERMTANLDAQTCVLAVDHTISSCSHISGTILYLYFIKHWSNDRIRSKLGYQSTRFNEVKNDACVEFAERFDFWRKEDGSSIEDLQVFESLETAEEISKSGH
ncbi:ArpU family phage packaging/lysis transcriptional regulator [Lactobacillus sp. ESL0230]|uniref:ArpU family phage packaging/lysis transcriptional regulator n=1 Tax=Lactobacillus sp. ESL0230 TaxID=2069353 RepID=UPI000EFADDB6|nr:ArpU family phage packaging/lysis transcriptional regulator [Lactobacillus sp. ESL0230]RMC46567.1 hypothetical protein F5ESL0230_04735 [Lactobacillus sp. ESL0230]